MFLRGGSDFRYRPELNIAKERCIIYICQIRHFVTSCCRSTPLKHILEPVNHPPLLKYECFVARVQDRMITSLGSVEFHDDSEE